MRTIIVMFFSAMFINGCRGSDEERAFSPFFDNLQEIVERGEREVSGIERKGEMSWSERNLAHVSVREVKFYGMIDHSDEGFPGDNEMAAFLDAIEFELENVYNYSIETRGRAVDSGDVITRLFGSIYFTTPVSAGHVQCFFIVINETSVWVHLIVQEYSR